MSDTTTYVCDKCGGDAYSKQTTTGKTVYECSNPNHKNPKNQEFQYCMWKKPAIKGQQQPQGQWAPQPPPTNQVPQPQFPHQPNLTITTQPQLQYNGPLIPNTPTLQEVRHVENYELSSEIARLREVINKQDRRLDSMIGILQHMDLLLSTLINTEEKAQQFVETGVKRTKTDEVHTPPNWTPQN